MSSARQVLLGFLAALLSGALVIGGLSISLLQGGATSLALAPTSTPFDTQSPFIEITVLAGGPTLTSPPPTPTATFPPPLCTPPDGWVQQAVGPDDTMQSLADAYGVSVETLAEANCLRPSSPVDSSMTISVPPIPPTPTFVATATHPPTARPTRTPIPCGRPAGWQIYVVRHGDTLYQIAQMFGTTVSALQNANCLTGTLIKTGQSLYVPNVPPRTPLPSPTKPPTVAPTNIPTTSAPPTARPPTVAPTTAVPTTAAPTTAVPTTAAPTTAVPTTAIPTTAVPPTAEPTTAIPTTIVPTTAIPTVEPTTAVPTTVEPTTAVPTTVEPTTAVPTTIEPTVPSTVDPTSSNSSFRLHTTISAWKRYRVSASH